MFWNALIWRPPIWTLQPWGQGMSGRMTWVPHPAVKLCLGESSATCLRNITTCLPTLPTGVSNKWAGNTSLPHTQNNLSSHHFQPVSHHFQPLPRQRPSQSAEVCLACLVCRQPVFPLCFVVAWLWPWCQDIICRGFLCFWEDSK